MGSDGRAGGSGEEPMGEGAVREWAVYAQRDAARLLVGALLLYRRGRFRGAIRLAVLAIEESLKGVEVGAALRGRRAVTRGDWRALMGHEYKLARIPDHIVWEMERDCGLGARVHVARDRGEGRAEGRACVVKNARRARDLVRNLQLVKEACVYEGWDAGGGAWEGLDVDGGEAGALALFVLELARVHYGMLHAGTGFALGTLADRGPTSGDEGPRAAWWDPGELRRGEGILRRLSAAIDARAGAEAA